MLDLVDGFTDKRFDEQAARLGERNAARPAVEQQLLVDFAARLQAATASENPVLVRLSAASGHGMGTGLSEKIAQQADVFAFLFDQLGMAAK